MSNYITPGTIFPNFYQFPDFLLKAPISQTAKLAYMVLYDRARLSQKNDWVNGGRIYTVFPIKDMAEVLGKSESTVKSVYNELRHHGLLFSTDGGFSKANILYVLLPGNGQFSERVRKKNVVDTDICTYDGGDSVLTEGRILTPNKVNETSDRNQNKGVIERAPYGRYQNIYLSEEECGRLRKEMPNRLDALIEEMSVYCEANGKKYQNYEAALHRWANREKVTQPKDGSPTDYSFREGDSF